MSSRHLVLAVFVTTILTGLGASPASAQTTDLSTDDALARAFEQNPSLRAVAIERRRASLLVESERARYVPTFTGEAGYRTQRSPSLGRTGVQFLESNSATASGSLAHTFPVGTTVTGGVEAQRSVQSSIILGELGAAYGLNVFLELSQPWLRGFGRDVVESQLRAARAQQDSAEAQLEQEASALARDLLTAYWQLWLTQRQYEIQQDALEVAQTELEVGQNRLDSGAISAADLIPLRTEIASLQEQLASTRSAMDRQAVELWRLMGDSARDGRVRGADISASSTPPEPGSSPELSKAMERAERSSYSLRQLEQAIEIARIESAVAEDDKLVRLDSTASVQVSGLERDVPEVFEQVATAQGWAAFLGLSIQLPVSNAYAKARAERANWAVHAAKSNYEAALDSLRARVESSITVLDATRERLELARQTAELTRQLVSAESSRFRAGESTSLDVTQALQQQREAELRVVQARVDLVIGRLELLDATGELLENVDVPAPSPEAPDEANSQE